VDEEIECAALSGALVPGVSLHAVTGVRAKGIQTMKVFVSIGGAVAVALLDSGSSHNFIDVDMARRAGVPLQPGTGLSVTVANGDRIPSLGSATEQVVHIGGEAFHVDVHALPLCEYDMVLGVQWLASLGPVLWDFTCHTLAFVREGRRVLWHGTDATPGLAAVSLSSPGGALLDELLEEFAGLFAEPQGLPPRRHLSHRIRLKPGTGAVASGRTDTPTHRRTSWSGSAMTCYDRESSAQARRLSLHRRCSSARPTAPGGSASTIRLSTTQR
jgi:hypothetical protein